MEKEKYELEEEIGELKNKIKELREGNVTLFQALQENEKLTQKILQGDFNGG